MKNTHNKITFFVSFLSFSLAVNAQQDNQKFVNEGHMSVADGGVLSTIYSFDNRSTGQTTNNGTTYFYSNFNNDGIYSFDKNNKSGKAVFTPFANKVEQQVLTGEAISEFNDVDLNNATPEIAFDLKNNFDVHGTMDFQDGIIKVDSLLHPVHGQSKGMLSFQHGSRAQNYRDQSHAEGQVEKIGGEEFQYPKGDKGIHRYASISAPTDKKDAFTGQYVLSDKKFFSARTAKSGIINVVDTNEYWIIEKGTMTKESIILTLSWDSRTTPGDLLKDPEKDLHIVRWDDKQQMWVDEGGVVDVSNKEITTPTSVQGYGFFTLATVHTKNILEGGVIIYNLVTPNGDDKNDYLIIDNIQKFPNNTLEVFNRWGVRVYETSNYDSRGNVFAGYSDGRVTLDKSAKLPSGTYYYILNYEYKDVNGSRMIKKAGNLHLENN